MKWVAEIPRSSLPDEMKMTAWNTVFDIGQFKQVIDKWLATPSGKESRWLSGEPMRQAILDRLKERMNDDEFEKFVAALLKVLGFERTEAIGGPGDEGIDALGTLDVYGLGQVNLKVQVKHVAPDKEIGDNVVRAFRDGILQDEHGAIITTGKFHPNAVEVANDPRKKTIWLIDGEELVDLVLKHYQDFRSN
ncbi:MAG: restriction endonuclease [Chloroflexi bacterium]|nr:restriction endonuclease [Chloroflexota bacterium]